MYRYILTKKGGKLMNLIGGNDEVLSIAGIHYVIEYNKSYWAIETRLMNLEDSVKHTEGQAKQVALGKIRDIISDTPGLRLID